MKKITSIKDISIGDVLICSIIHGYSFKYNVTGVDVENQAVDVSCIRVDNNNQLGHFDHCVISNFSHILNKDEKKHSVGTLQNMLKRRDSEIARLKKELKEYKAAIFQIRNILPD